MSSVIYYKATPRDIKWGAPHPAANGSGQMYQYYLRRQFAWFPTYTQGTLIWFSSYWVSWPETDKGPVMAADVLSAQDIASMMGRNEQQYVSTYPYDPRETLGN